MPNSPRKNCPTLTIAIYHLKPWTWVLTQFWTFEIISINKKVTAFQTKVVFSFFDISSKLPGWILGTLRGPKKKIFFLLICMAMSYNILNFEPNRWLCCPKSVTLGMKPPLANLEKTHNLQEFFIFNLFFAEMLDYLLDFFNINVPIFF